VSVPNRSRDDRLAIDDAPLRLRLQSLVRSFAECRVAVVGDIVADQFVYGEISRVSREAPVLILRHERTETLPGGAANCAMNLAALGAKATLIGVIGDDEAGRKVIDKLSAAGVACDSIIVIKGARTTTKVRILAGRAHAPRQQVIRVDYEGETPMNETSRQLLHANARDVFARSDAIVISDYGYGIVSAEVAQSAQRAMARGIPVVVDSRHRLFEFKGFTSATPNEAEVEDLCRERIAGVRRLEEIGEELRQRLRYRALLITRGGDGMLLLEAGRPPLHIPIVGSRDAVDVTGAGDTVIATYTLALACGATFSDAARLANYAGSVVVMKRGTATVSTEELLTVLAHESTG
jgi:rfaE bifunctional protein kinase chain/domain